MNSLFKAQLRIRATLIDEALGTASNNPNIHDEYIASKAPDAMTREEEVAALGVAEAVEKSMTIFPKDEDGDAVIWPYQIKGFFKESCGFMRKVPGSLSSKEKAYKKLIDGLIFVNENKKIKINASGFGECQRPLRAETAQGARVALAHSETVPAGAYFEFTVDLLDPKHRDLVLEWLDYGEIHGLGQWRNSGKGRFTYEVIEG